MSKAFTENRKARHDYAIIDSLEAGIELFGTEVKSIRASNVNLRGSFVSIKNDQACLKMAYIARYKKDAKADYDQYRDRKLLLKKQEIKKLSQKAKEKGYAIIPLKLYAKKGLIKLEIALGKGKKIYDKKASKKAADIKREMERNIRI